MTKRRSLNDALTPEQQAFLERGTTDAVEPKVAPARKPKPVRASSKHKTSFEPTAKTPDTTPAIVAVPQPVMPGVVSLNVRIEPHISTALLRASMERKIQRLSPFTQQDIVAEALALWLKTHGFYGQE
ncbi:MAG: hypothetical protein K1X78_19065 [Verrucomicrobiaceae bacterium]|nr:hypothetical protein [Verrucomicrobiaceae bacterium]